MFEIEAGCQAFVRVYGSYPIKRSTPWTVALAFRLLFRKSLRRVHVIGHCRQDMPQRVAQYRIFQLSSK
jgi:hypothetical protein